MIAHGSRGSRRVRRRLRLGLTMTAAAATAVSVLGGPAQARQAPAADRTPSSSSRQGADVGAPSAGAPSAKLSDPDTVLAKGWQTSGDRAVTTSGDADGFHVLVADASAGYQWRTAATLSEPGFDTDQWIGQSCLTASGKRAVVVYAPRQFTNLGPVLDSGAFVATVDLTTGQVTKLPFTASLAYYDPGCGTGELATLSATSTKNGRTVSTVRVLDTATGKVVRQTDSTGQLTSAVPYNGGVVAALGSTLVSVDDNGGTRLLASEKAVPYRIHPDSAGGLAYQVTDKQNTDIHRFAQGKSTLVGSGKTGAVQVAASAGNVFLTGSDAAKIPESLLKTGGWRALAAPVDADVSTTGALAVTGATNHVKGTAGQQGAEPTEIAVTAAVTATGKQASFALEPAALDPKAGSTASPALTAVGVTTGSTGAATKSSATTATKGSAKASAGTASGTGTVDPSTVTWDPDRGCAVPRNDPTIQTYQASAPQVEWAADLAVQGQLTRTRGANWEDSGMPVSWSPQDMFPLQQIKGGGQLPAQVLLGVLAQESNTMQASPHAVDGVTGNANQGGFYGNGIDWGTVDCGYGVGQITTGMAINTPAGTAIADGNIAKYTTAEMQQAIATDYASNIAASANMLIDKWNQLKAAGIIAGNGDPSGVENWWFAVWAYNAGVEPGSPAFGNTTGCTPSNTCTDNGGAGGNWGLGWLNNPANPIYPADRGVFTNDPAKTKVPNHWTYPELVMGWAYSPVSRYNYTTKNWAPAYATPTHVSTPYEPSFMAFCTSADSCTPNAAPDSNGTANKAGLCGLSNLHCWWNQPVTWVNCSVNACGGTNLTYTSSSSVPMVTNPYPGDCRPVGGTAAATGSDSSGVTPPTGTIVVGNTSVPGASCSAASQQSGQFGVKFDYASPYCNPCTSPIDYPGKIDFHQLGVGYNGHIWFTHTVAATFDSINKVVVPSDPAHTVVGTWTPPALNGWVRVFAHIPDSGDTTQQAPYTIQSGTTTETRFVNTEASKNRWVPLGVFDFDSSQSESVSLTNATPDGAGTMDIAWDAVGFQPLPTKPSDFVVQMGDSYSSGEGNAPWYPETDHGPYADQNTQKSSGETWNACRRGQNSWIRQATLTGHSTSIGSETDASASDLDFHSVACSGAYTGNVDGNNTQWGENGQFHEMDQVDSGYLDAHTTLVTLTVGGNDAGFSTAVQDCIEFSCQSNSTVEGNINSAVSSAATVIQAIHAAAPQARIIVLGYPDLFDPSTVTSGGCNITNAFAASTLNGWGDYFRSTEGAMVAEVAAGTYPQETSGAEPVTFVDANPFFQGYQDCGQTPGINDLVAAPNGPGDFEQPGAVFNPKNWIEISRSSFHPNATGQYRYMLALESALG
ncbi:hypothetical protein ABH926_007132 [Catenulispora sp. GP43]|uniref:golvesin C-terminal-like domain-containing protein n=1 Tax=Catenulispora sp. GP43 TaxID=3156263 RepID=UPI0035166429